MNLWHFYLLVTVWWRSQTSAQRRHNGHSPSSSKRIKSLHGDRFTHRNTEIRVSDLSIQGGNSAACETLRVPKSLGLAMNLTASARLINMGQFQDPPVLKSDDDDDFFHAVEDEQRTATSNKGAAASKRSSNSAFVMNQDNVGAVDQSVHATGSLGQQPATQQPTVPTKDAVFQEPHDHSQLASLSPAFRFSSSGGGGGGIVECLMRGDRNAFGAFLMPPVAFEDAGHHFTASLPPPSVLDPGVYAVKCVLLYGSNVFAAAHNASFRWPNFRAGPQFVGTAVDPASPLAGSSGGALCAGLARLLGPSSGSQLRHLVGRLKPGACPGVLVEASATAQSWGGSSNVFDGPPALIRVRREEVAPAPLIDSLSTTPSLPTPPPPPLLPACARGDEFGRWLPTWVARPLVANGDEIPAFRQKYWVPYSCRPTFWNLEALKKVAQEGGTQSSACDSSSSPPPSSSSSSPPPPPCLRCRLDNLRRVVFTGASVTSTLMSAMRRHVLGESEEAARRDKEADHENEAKGRALVNSSLALGPSHSLEFVVVGHFMPVTAGLVDPTEAASLRRRQIRDLVRVRGPLSALVLHVGLHELCGAYGPGYPPKHSPCASRQELVDTYSDFASELTDLGLHATSLFRSLLGSFPDVTPSGPWRWRGFADCRPAYDGGGRTPTKARNPCPAISAPFANEAFSQGDASKAWSQSGQSVRVVDAFSPLHASPTSDAGVSELDGMHPLQDSDEALAINQAIMNALCAS